MVTVIGEVEQKDQYMNEMYRILKAGGILYISECSGDPDRMTTNEIKAWPGIIILLFTTGMAVKRTLPLNLKSLWIRTIK